MSSRGRPYVELKFSDNGIGFNEEFAEQIFVIFQRLHERKKYPGTGIGLALCKRIVDNHAAKIFASSSNCGAILLSAPTKTGSEFKVEISTLELFPSFVQHK